MQPKALVLSGDGVNCENEVAFALTSVGFSASQLHITDLLSAGGYRCLYECEMLVIPGGFSFADEIRSGKVLALKLREKLFDQLNDFVQRDKFLLGVCNGFQVLTMLGLLPDYSLFGPHAAALVSNQSGNFIDRWVRLVTNENIKSPLLTGLRTMTLPIRHGEGRLIVKSEIIESINQFACLRYEENVNGSFDNIAALTNKKGNIFGIMPHPEAFVRFSQHPAWTKNKSAVHGKPDGLILFQNAFNALK
jgi:phosphoribosylformylglycinamidine synthase subunit PurQ / glutaminase